MVRPLTMIVLLLAARLAGAEPAKSPDYYALALTWHPTLCLRFPQNPECAADRPGHTLVLHGLWPERRGDPGFSHVYCGVSPEVRAVDKPKTWCALPEVPMYPEVAEAVDGVMPGRMVCLDRHEWFKHGTCSGLTADAYYTHSIELTRRFQRSEFARFLENNAGRVVKAAEVAGEFERVFGPAAAGAFNLYCSRVGGVDVFKELVVYLAPALGPDDYARPEPYQTSDCPAEFRVSFPRR